MGEEAFYNYLIETLNRMETKIDQIGTDVAAHDTRLTVLEGAEDTRKDRGRNLRGQLFSVIAGVSSTVIGAAALHYLVK